MHRILVADDDPVMLNMVAKLLHKEGHEVVKTTSAQGVHQQIEQANPDLLLVDVNLPDRNGLLLCQELRSNPEFDNMPIVFLTGASSSPDSVAEALNAGGDDYIQKPFAARELAARVRAHLRRVQVRREISTPLIRLYPATEMAIVDNREVDLTHVEYNLLQHMCSRPNEWQTTRDLLVEVWSYPGNVGDAALVRNHVRNLRRKIEVDADRPTIILSRHRRGYMIAARVEVVEASTT
ncbi:MAG: response regulator transcription factor [Chloroflexota bacterium]